MSRSLVDFALDGFKLVFMYVLFMYLQLNFSVHIFNV